MPESTEQSENSLRTLLILAGIMAIGFKCMYIFRFAVGALNLIFVYVYFLIPFLAIRPVLRLHRWRRSFWILLIPVLLFSSFMFLGRLLIDVGGTEHTQPLQTFQQGSFTLELGRFENGGALGVRGVYLQQRRLILPGLYLVRPVDFFDNALEAHLFVEGTTSVRVRASGNYHSHDAVIDKVYHLKPWVYF